MSKWARTSGARPGLSPAGIPQKHNISHLLFCCISRLGQDYIAHRGSEWITVMTCDIQNEYLTANCREKIWTYAGPELAQNAANQ